MFEIKDLLRWITEATGIVFWDVVGSLVLLALILVIRAVLVRAITRSPGLTVEVRRRWIMGIRNILAGVFIVGLIFIWAHALNAFAVSLVGIAVALVLATKELLLCISGAIVRVGSNAYGLGDRIAIGGHRGNVLDQNLFATTILEIGPGEKSQQYTGRVVVFPNSLLLTSPLINETYAKQFIVHQVTVPLSAGDAWQEAEQILLDAARAECASIMEVAKRHMKEIEGRTWLDAPSVEPRVTLHLPEPGRIDLLVRFPAPSHRTAKIEQAILRRFLSMFQIRPPAKPA